MDIASRLLLVTSLASPWVSACSLAPERAEHPVEEAVGNREPKAAMRAWRCGDLLAKTRHDEEKDRLILVIDGDSFALTPITAASGAHFSGADGHSFWSKGESEALLSLPMEAGMRPCDPAG